MSVGYPLKFGKYLLLERVNVGGMAEVFKAKTFGVAGFERILAIKRILPSLVEDEEFIRMFIDEARIAVQLNHANIVQIYELGKHGEHYYIAMEYLPSRDLRGILDKMRLSGQLMPIPQAAYIISKVCEGLDYAHRRRDPAGTPMNIVHRDVSPQNILVSYEGEIKIIDFGIAKAANRASKTQAGVLKGKFGYMSPEQVRGLPIDRRSDIFAVGVLLYEMLTGERLFIGESDFSTLERVRNAEVPPPTTFNKKITAELEQIVLRALAREVEDRYQWSSELAEDLQRFLIEDRSIYSAKRLAAYMKETYADIIGAERKKMEDFLQMASDELDAKPPLAPDTNDGYEEVSDEIEEVAEEEEDEEAPGFEEDKTFVIEASEAGKQLVKPGTDPGGPPGGPRIPTEPTNDDFLGEASLYGGDDDDDMVDDSKTEVSFVNPFDENAKKDPDDDPHGEGTDPGLGLPPGVMDDGEDAPISAAAEAKTTIRPPGSRSFPSEAPESDPAPQRPPPPAAGAPPARAPAPPAAAASSGAFDPVAAAMADDLRAYSGDSGALPPSPGLPAQGLGVPGVDGTAPGVPGVDGTAPGVGDDVAGRQLPSDMALQSPGGEVATPAPEGEPRRMPMGCLIGLIATVGLGFLAFIGAGVALVVVLTAKEPASLQVVTEGGAAPPGAVSLFIDDVQVADALPAMIPIEKEGTVVIAVRGEGLKPFEMEVPGIAPGQTRLIEVPLTPDGPGGSKPKDPAGDGDKDGQEDGTEDAQLADAPEGQAAPGTPDGDAKQGEKAEAQPSDPKATSPGADPATKDPAASTTVAAAGDRWRLSFTAVHSEMRRPIRGAEVLLGDAVLGTTPFEVELPKDKEKLVLQVRAPGYVSREIEFKREGRDHVGPTSIALTADAASGDAPVPAPPAGEDVDDEDDEVKPSEGGGSAPTGNAAGERKASADDAEAAADDDDEPEGAVVAKADPAPRKRSEPAPRARDDDDDDGSSASNHSASNHSASNHSAANHSASTKRGKSDKKKPARTSAKSKAPARSSDDGKKDEGKAPAAEKKPSESVLQVGTRPRANVFIDRKARGTTPLMHKKAVTLSPGSHFMMLEDMATKEQVKMKIELEPGEAVIIFDFNGHKVVKQKGVKSLSVVK